MTTAQQIKQGFDLENNQSYNSGYVQGVNEGYNQGADATIIDVVKRGHKNGIAIELLAKIVDLSVERVTEIINKV
jgi:flagellar biosynthesis/type III secretory pathway protein FliH